MGLIPGRGTKIPHAPGQLSCAPRGKIPHATTKTQSSSPKNKNITPLQLAETAFGFSHPRQGTVSAGSACIYPRDEHTCKPVALVDYYLWNLSNSGEPQAGMTQGSVVMSEGHVITRGWTSLGPNKVQPVPSSVPGSWRNWTRGQAPYICLFTPTVSESRKHHN